MSRLCFRKTDDTNASRLRDNKFPGQLFPHIVYQIEDYIRQCSPYVAGETDEDHATRRMHVGIYKLAEIPVFREKDSLFLQSQVYHHLIIGSTVVLCHGKDIMTRIPKHTNNCKIATLICQEAHRMIS